MSSKAVDTMLTQTPAKLHSVLVSNEFCRSIILLVYCCIRVDLNITAISAIAVLYLIQGEIPSREDT
jgi:hypothetical protein